MTHLTFHWFLPTYGDSRDIVGGGHGLPPGAAGGARPATPAYLRQIVHAAEHLGFVGALTPTGAWCEDAWLTTAMLTETTERLKFLVAFRPGLVTPTLAAQMGATFQRHSGGRGITEFVMSGHPHVEEAYWFGEGVLPILRGRGLWEHPAAAGAHEPASIPFASTGSS
ncbi:LLM class flavin-dependent oxidoreductase [Streptosporangium sp. NPDC050855]|uniref:LLM class flavin-dependent oxidoreductase n=1 Tax=Streptosporangium sp. NPDC050855 TaxID=3366194 RepID=UPI00378F083F